MQMPFGKHAGKALAEIPLSYLVWLAEECDLRAPLRRAVEEELRRRILGGDETDGARAAWTPPRHGAPELSSVEELVRAGRRALASKHHPDRGGTLTAMQRVNACADWLLNCIRGTRR